MDELLKYKAYFESEWEILSKAPTTFIMLAAVSLLIGYYLAKWRYAGIVANLQARVEFLGEQLDRSKLVENPVVLQPVLLKERTLKFVEALNEFVSNEESKSRSILSPNESSDEQEIQLHYHANEWMKKYTQKFKAEAISLRAELLDELPKYSLIDGIDEHIYTRPVNFFGLESIASELYQLALKLEKTQ